jgi:hypothetical protein
MVMLWILILACNDGDKGGGGDDSDTTPIDDSSPIDDSGTEKPPVLTGPCENGTKIGFIEVSHTSHDDALVTAQVEDSVYPTSKLTLVEEKNGCKMMRKENPFCDPTCKSNFTCNLEGECVPYPVRIEVGTIEITGTVNTHTMEPQTAYYWDGDAELPLFDVGATIKGTVEGSEKLAGFELHGFGVAQVALPDGMAWDMKPPYTWTLEEDTAFEFTWVPSKEDEGDMYITLAIDEHGATPVTLYCEVEDTGSLTIPVSMVNQLVAAGVSGFPAAYVYRRSVDHIDTDLGCVEMEVSVQHEPFLTVEGHTPCFSDKDCPKGQYCNLPTQTCVDEKK